VFIFLPILVLFIFWPRVWRRLAARTSQEAEAST
jgi:uncharacterized membrane protein